MMANTLGVIKVNRVKIIATMLEAKIDGISIASFNDKGPTDELVLGRDHKSRDDLNLDSVFRAASLSKPVFAYLVLKLIEDNKSGRAKAGLGQFPEGVKFDLKTPLYKVFPDFLDKFGPDIETQERAKKLTAQHVLSHTTGLPIKQQEGELLEFQFEPGAKYGYSNPGIDLLQKFIDKLTSSNLNDLAKANVFDDPEMKMTSSSFYPEYNLQLLSEKSRDPGKIYLKATKKGLEYEVLDSDGGSPWHSVIPWNKLPTDFPRNSSEIIQSKEKCLPVILAHASKAGNTPLPFAANSLHTTATDYARFIAGWLRNDKLRDMAFTSQIDMENDSWAEGQGLSLEDRKKVGWGLGIGLQLDSNGKATSAFHSGDMDNWRAFVAIDLVTKNGIVYLSNSRNGLLLADQIISPNVELNDGLKYIFEKYGFARKIEFGWQEKEIDRVCKIIVKNEMNLGDLQEKGLIKIDDNKDLRKLDINCDQNHLPLNRAVKKEFDNFIAANKLEENKDYTVEIKADKKGNILNFKVHILDEKLYGQFIDNLIAERLLPAPANTLQDAMTSSSYKTPTLTPATTKEKSSRGAEIDQWESHSDQKKKSGVMSPPADVAHNQTVTPPSEASDSPSSPRPTALSTKLTRQ